MKTSSAKITNMPAQSLLLLTFLIRSKISMTVLTKSVLTFSSRTIYLPRSLTVIKSFYS